MADFVLNATTNSGTVNFPKFDRQAIPPGTDPTKIISGSEWSALCQAVVDLRNVGLLSASVFAFGARYANPGSIPSIPGHNQLTRDYLYIDNNAEMTFHKRDNSEWKLVTTNFLNRTGINQVYNPSGTLHVYSDGTDARYMILQQANQAGRKNTVEFMRETSNQKVFVGQFQNASDGFVPANAFIVEVNDGTTTRNVMHGAVDGSRVTLGHSSNTTLRLGVHTTTPSKKVDINGDLNVTQSASLADTYVTGTLFTPGISDLRRVSGSVQLTGSLSIGTILQQEKNNVINGNFRFWQRGSTDLVKTTASISRTYFPDRWNAYMFKFSSANTQFTYSRQAANTPASSGSLSGSDWCTRIKCDTSSGFTTDNWGFLVQEIDHTLVKELRGKKVTFTAKLRAGNAFANSIMMYVRQNTGAITENLTTYTGGYDMLGAFVGTAQGVTGSWRQFSFTTTGSVDPAANGMAIWIGYQVTGNGHSGGAGDYIELGEAMLTAGETIPNTFYTCTPTVASELALCQRYYEKSYAIDTAPGTVTLLGAEVTSIIPGGSATVGQMWPIGAFPRFKVVKRTTPTIKLYNPGDGSVDIWRFTNQYDSYSLPSNISEQGFTVNDDDFNFSMVAGFAEGHWTADAEI